MAELTIEEKAKAYDKALDAACCIYNNMKEGDNFSGMEDLEVIFPELKESEDERIRKELLEHCKNQAEPYIQTGNKCPQIQSWIDWLERQCVHKQNWSEEDENGLGDALWAIKQARTIAKNENEMGGLWYAERWLKFLKDRIL